MKNAVILIAGVPILVGMVLAVAILFVSAVGIVAWRGLKGAAAV